MAAVSEPGRDVHRSPGPLAGNWLLILAITSTIVFMSGCVVRRVNVQRHFLVVKEGARFYWPKTEPIKLTVYRKTSGCAVAFLPFTGTGRWKTPLSGEVAPDFSFVNEVMSEATRSLPLGKGCRVVLPGEAQTKLSDAGQISKYARVVRDYVKTGMLDERTIRDVASVLEADLVVQGALEYYRIEPRQHYLQKIRLRFFALDGKSGKLAWNIFSTGAQYPVDNTRSKVVDMGTKTISSDESWGEAIAMCVAAVGIGGGGGTAIAVTGAAQDSNGLRITGTAIALSSAALCPMALFVKRKPIITRERDRTENKDRTTSTGPVSPRELVKKIVTVTFQKIVEQRQIVPTEKKHDP